MANETDTGLVGPDTTAEALAALAARPFDPATLLTASPAPPLPYAVGPSAEVVHTFDPAANLGDAARRGPAMIGDGKPLVARIGGVEVVTIPVEHYAALVSLLALARGAAGGAPQLDAEGMFGFLMRLDDGKPFMPADLVKATGLDAGAFAERKAAWKAAQPKPWEVDSMDADGTMRGKTPEGIPFTISPVLDDDAPHVDPTASPEAAPVEIAPTPEETTIDLAPKVVEVPLTPATQEDTYFKGTRDGKKRGGAMGRKGQPDNREVDPHDLPGGRAGQPLGAPAGRTTGGQREL